MAHDMYKDVPYVTSVLTFLSYAMLFAVGKIEDAFQYARNFFTRKHSDIAPIVDDFEDFYTRRLYSRLKDCWGRPVCSKPGARIDVLDRTPEKNAKRCINLGSYNYLGYAEVPGGVNQGVLGELADVGVATCGSSHDVGRPQVLAQLEALVAKFLHKEDALVFGMGFATNSLVLPSIVGPGCLIVSDALNHASIVVGARSSGAKIKTFLHNDPVSLEETLRTAIAQGQPKTAAPWRKILIIVEGIYSMEGHMCNLQEIVRIKKKYGAYLWLDEAHSIGAMGPTGRGVSEQLGVDTADIDIMMGTFTKSFGGVGGYVAASRAVIDLIRSTSSITLHTSAMSPPTARHLVWVLKQLMDLEEGSVAKTKIKRLRQNSIYFRKRLIELGLQVYGDEGSPVIPIMLYNPGKIAAFSRECLARNLAVVVVGFPATPLVLSRARICISAAHTKEDLDYALRAIDEVAERVGVKYCKQTKSTSSEDGGYESPVPHDLEPGYMPMIPKSHSSPSSIVVKSLPLVPDSEIHVS